MLHVGRKVRAMTNLRPWLSRAAALAKNFWLDVRFSGASLRGSVPSRFADQGAHDTVNSEYAALEKIFAGRILPSDVLIDVGCGRGRVINWWLSRGWRNRIVGLELDPEIAAATAERLSRYPNVSILAGDAISNLPADATVLYLYNPFTAAVMQRFKEAVQGRNVTILYYCPEFLPIFRDDPRWQIETFSLPRPLHNYAVIVHPAATRK
jgi:hypothetical protein